MHLQHIAGPRSSCVYQIPKQNIRYMQCCYEAMCYQGGVYELFQLPRHVAMAYNHVCRPNPIVYETFRNALSMTLVLEAPASSGFKHSELNRHTRAFRSKTMARSMFNTVAKVSASATTIPPARVAVIGAGVVGLTAATKLLELFPSLHLTVVAENIGKTTSEGAGGLWKPYTLEDTPPERYFK